MSGGDDLVDRFRALIAERLGLRGEADRAAELAALLQRRAGAISRGDAEAYLDGLERGPAAAEVATLARELTIGETYFFRNVDHFRALVEAVVPALADAGRRRLRILSAGCATGEEAYTIAILLADPRFAGLDVEILGVDVNPAAIERARKARYSPWALRDTPADVAARCFSAEGAQRRLEPSRARTVTFEVRNLVEDDAALWRARAYDVVFCRNVLMYFTPAQARALVRRIEDALAPGGFLFLGHAETVRGLSEAFHLEHTHETFYYRRGAAERSAPDEAGAWHEIIERASERITTLTSPGSAAAPLSTPPPAAPPPLAEGLELLRKERFADCEAWLRALPPAALDEGPAQLLLGVALINGGRVAEAERVARAILGRDERDAGAHYLLALASEQAGDLAAAREHDRAAADLDERFAMPRLHLGLLARRRGDLPAARRELERALALIGAETDARVLLFGGGFSREALREVCRAELAACEGGA